MTHIALKCIHLQKNYSVGHKKTLIDKSFTAHSDSRLILNKLWNSCEFFYIFAFVCIFTLVYGIRWLLNIFQQLLHTWKKNVDILNLSAVTQRIIFKRIAMNLGWFNKLLFTSMNGVYANDE